MCLEPRYIKGRQVPCRKCIECKIQYSEEWAIRCVLEAKKHEKNCFLTLTYNEANLPDRASLKKRDFQLFMKRLRKHLSRFAIKVRYFACGEYGSKGRPHYHCILFGYDFDDKYFFKYDRRGNALYRSPSLEKIWILGFSSIGELDYESAKYCAKYMQADLDKKDLREKPFTLMSRKPGIALDVVPSSVYKDFSVYHNGRKLHAPRAFRKVFKCDFPELYDLKNAKLRETYTQYVSKEISRNERRKKYKKIFEKNLDNHYRLVVSLKRGKKD